MDIARQRVVPKNRLCPCVPHSLRAPSERPKTSLSASLTSLTRLQTEIDRERAVPMDALRDPEKDEDRCLDPKARFCMLRSFVAIRNLPGARTLQCEFSNAGSFVAACICGGGGAAQC